MKKFLDQRADLFKPSRIGKDKSNGEAKSRLPLIGRFGAVEKRVKRTMFYPFRSLGDKAVESVTDRLINKVINERSAEVDRAAAQAVQRTVAIIAIGLWGATSAAAISLALSAAIGGQPKEWLAYVLIVTGGLSMWNVAAFVYYLRQFRGLEGDTQRRLLILVTSKVGVKGLFIIGVPVVTLFALGIARLLLG